jgi:SAM-dependent methyltransferase
MNFKERLYNKYVSSGQAGTNKVSASSLFSSNAPYIKRLIQKHIPRDKAINILDLGCGDGKYIYFLKKEGYKNIVGLDLSEEQVEVAHSLGLEEVQRGSLDQYLDECKTKYDVVLMIDILEHLTRDQLFYSLDQVYSMLKPEGVLIAHVPNGEGIFGSRIFYGDLTHEWAFTPSSVKQLTKTIGFSSVECFEDKPAVYNITSFLRRVFWDVSTLYNRTQLFSETGATNFILTQNLLFKAKK